MDNLARRSDRADTAYIDAAHRVHVRVEDGVRTGKDCGIGRFPSQAMAMNKAWFAAALIAATLLTWLRLLALDGPLARAEPKTLRYKILHAAARLTRSARQRQLKIQASWPWAAEIITAWNRISALAKRPLTSSPALSRRPRQPRAHGTPATRPDSRASVTTSS